MSRTVDKALKPWQKQGLLTEDKAAELRVGLSQGDSAWGIRIFAALGAVLAPSASSLLQTASVVAHKQVADTPEHRALALAFATRRRRMLDDAVGHA